MLKQTNFPFDQLEKSTFAEQMKYWYNVCIDGAKLENTDDFVRMKHGRDFDKFTKEVLSNGQILYKYDNGSISYSYEFTEL